MESPVLVEKELDPNKRNTFGNAIEEFVDPSADSEEYDYETESVIGDSMKTFKHKTPPVRERNHYTSNFNETMMTKILRQDDDIRINIVTASTQPQLKLRVTK